MIVLSLFGKQTISLAKWIVKIDLNFSWKKNPNLSLLAEENGIIFGTALGSFDGRRGYLQKVVTDKNNRKKGIGQQLVNEVLKRLREVGALYVPISVEPELIPFYEKCGFVKKDSLSMSRDL